MKLDEYEKQDGVVKGIRIVVRPGYVKITDVAADEARYYPRPNGGDPVISTEGRCKTATQAMSKKAEIEAEHAQAAMAAVTQAA